MHQAHEAGADYKAELARLDPVLLRVVRHRLRQAHVRADQGARPAMNEYDALRGLTGLGHLLTLRAPDSDELRDVLSYLVRLTEPDHLDDGSPVPGWWNPVGPSGRVQAAFPGGHANHGMAHGIGGPLALLSLAWTAGVRVEGNREAIERICSWLDRWRHHGDGGTWWPYWITAGQLHTGQAVHGPQRPSWCYGAAGLGRAQQLAAHALNDPERAVLAEQAVTDALTHPVALGMLVDDSLCHGWAGHALVSHTTGIGNPQELIAPILRDGDVEQVADRLLTPRRERPGIGFLEGGAGIATTLHTLGAGSGGSWFSSFLMGGNRG
ncbi:hypothetical protein BJF83_24900 [Nocardiopsis sp. CNR-923]|nr:hypothetical protein BJF83_24900 [Nocardiopsis sp. CNR-923]